MISQLLGGFVGTLKKLEKRWSGGGEAFSKTKKICADWCVRSGQVAVATHAGAGKQA